MRLIAALVLLAVGCGGAEAATQAAGGDNTTASPAATAGTCETNLDAGTPCNPCPNSPRSVQKDTAPDPRSGVVFSQRECDCPQVHNGITGILWPSCPPAPPNEPHPTCAGVLAEYKTACGL